MTGTLNPFVFVTVGSTGFDDLVRAVDEVAAERGYEGLAQVGPGDYRPNHLEAERFLPSLGDIMAKADVVVSHGGAATTLEALTQGVRLVSAANPDRYDDHQTDVLSALSAAGHLVWCRNLARVGDDITRALTTDPVPIDTVPCTIGASIDEYLRRPPVSRVERVRRMINGRPNLLRRQ